MKRIIIFAVLVLQVFVSPLVAQIPVGTFRDHLSFYGCKSVAVTPEYVYAACNSGLMYVGKNDNGSGAFSKVDGLSGTSISRIHYDAASQYLTVAYDDGNLDFIRDDRIYNLRDIKDKSITSSKKVNGCLSYNGLVYLAYPFGIVSIDMTTLLIRDTWYTRSGDMLIEVNSMQVLNDEFVINTGNGIFCTPVNNPAIADFNTWQKEEDMGSFAYTLSCVFNGRVYAVREGENDTLYYKDGNGWHISAIKENDIRAITSDDSALVVCGWSFIKKYDRNENLVCETWWEGTYMWQNGCDVAMDGPMLWVADLNNGLHKIVCEDWSIELVRGKGPFPATSFAMDYSDGVIALVPGMVSDFWGNGWVAPNFSYFVNEQWHNIYQKDNSSLYNVYDLSAVAINPNNNSEFFVGAFDGGLRKYDLNRVAAVYDKTNSPIHSFDSLEGKVGGLAFDANNNLWVACSYSNVPIAVLQPNGSWQPLTLLSYATDNGTGIGQIMVDSRNYKWIVLPRANKLLVYDDNKTITNPNDDRIASVNMNTMANIETSGINCVVEDKSGEIWIGCNLGIKVVYNPSSVFKSTLYAQNILIKQIDYVQNLFEFEEVTCIAVDDANRKWVGTTKSGVFLISENGDQQLLHFTEENSPLLSNKIYNITINRATGEVFIATAGGLISYMGTSTEGKENYSEVTVFPNPVRETYHGVITVRGLMENSFCKIADAAGNLVWQGYANGGELTWDGKDFYGKRPATGVYFVFASDQTGKKRNVAKILFVK